MLLVLSLAHHSFNAHTIHMIFTGDPYDISAPAASSVVPMLSELASLSADLGANQVSSLLYR